MTAQQELPTQSISSCKCLKDLKRTEFYTVGSFRERNLLAVQRTHVLKQENGMAAWDNALPQIKVNQSFIVWCSRYNFFACKIFGQHFLWRTTSLTKYSCHLLSVVSSGWNEQAMTLFWRTPTTLLSALHLFSGLVLSGKRHSTDTASLSTDLTPGARMKTPEQLGSAFDSSSSVRRRLLSKLFICRP